MIYSWESLQKKQNQQDYAASQELDERSVSKCVSQPNPNICILLVENCKCSSTIQLAIASAAAATEQHRQQQQTTIALAATAGIFRLLYLKEYGRDYSQNKCQFQEKRKLKYHSPDVPHVRRCDVHEILLPAITTRIRTKNKKVSNSLFVFICSGFDCEVGSIKTLTSNNSSGTATAAISLSLPPSVYM
jgi:hypothetical protein